MKQRCIMRDKKTILIALLCCLLWGSAFPTVKTLYTLTGIGSDYGVKILLAGVRFSMAGLIILIYYTIRNKKSPLLTSRVAWRQVLLLGLTQTAFMYGFYYIGIYNTTGVKSSIISQTGIFLVVILSHFIYHDDRMHRGKWIGLSMGLLGIIAVNFNALSASSGLIDFSINGEGFLLISTLFSTASTFMVKRFGKKISPVLLNGWQITLGGLLLTAMGLITATEPLVINTPMAWALLIYSALISSGAFTLWYILLQHNRASELSMMKFSIPVFGSILSALILPGESLTIFIIISLLLVAVGIYQCNKPRVNA